jgi:predicted PurR-regulated permease PerM
MTSDDIRRWQWIAVFLILGWLIYKLGPILTPFVISAALGWLGDPLVDRLERAGRARSTSVVIVFVCMTALLALALFVLVPVLWQQVQVLIDSLPKLSSWLTGTVVPWVDQKFHVNLGHYVDPGFLFEWIRGHWEEAGGLAATVLGRISDSGLLLFSLLANIALVPVLSFYFLRDWDVFVARVRELLPRPMLPIVSQLALEADQVLGGFIRGQLSVMVALGTIYAIGLWAVGLSLGLLIGFVAGLVSFVPYMGAFIGVSAAVIASLVQHGDMFHLALVLAVFAVGQTIESFVLVPWLVGDRIGLHPVAVIFAIMAGGQLFGFLGVLLALPVAAVAMVLLRYGHGRYRQSGLYGGGLPDEIAQGDGPPDVLPSVASNEDLPAADPPPGQGA